MVQDWQIYTLSALLISSVAIGVKLWATSKKQSKKQQPEKWVLVGKVAKLVVFPVKSCQGVEVEKAELHTLGLKFCGQNIRDRDFMVVDANGNMKTMVTAPKMTFIKLDQSSSGKDTLVMSAPDAGSVTFTIPSNNNATHKLCRVKHDKGVKALDCGDEIAEWLQNYLKLDGLRLFYHDTPRTQRTFEKYHFECPMFELSDMGAFHNETSYLMVAQESINELNIQLKKDSSWLNWRPTILIDNVAEPFAEVNWSFVRIGNGNAILKAAVPCYRCPLTTIDHEKGELSKDGEPLKTLRAMNKGGFIADQKVDGLLKNKGIMGLRLGRYMETKEIPVVKVGDPVYAALL